MTKNHNHQRLVLLIGISFLLTSCNGIKDQVTIPPPGEDMPPVITVAAIPVEPTSSGDIEKTKVTSTTVSNVDSGTAVQLIVTALNGAAPKTTGGVQSLSVSISQGGATVFQGDATGVKDASGKVPNLLAVDKTPSNAAIEVQMNSRTIVTATSSNFNGQSNTVSGYFRSFSVRHDFRFTSGF